LDLLHLQQAGPLYTIVGRFLVVVFALFLLRVLISHGDLTGTRSRFRRDGETVRR
jgi:hypothetical protein